MSTNQYILLNVTVFVMLMNTNSSKCLAFYLERIGNGVFYVLILILEKSEVGHIY